MKNTVFLKYFLFATILVLLAACDNDFNDIGANIIGVDNFEYGDLETYKVNAFSQDLGPVETVDLPINPLGIYNNPVYGLTKANLVTQVLLATENPTIGNNPVMDSVVLKIPYFSTKVTDNSAANTKSIYKLDSIYGPTASKIKLRIYESGKYIENFEPSTPTEPKHYYSDQNTDFFNAKGPIVLNNGGVAENDEFIFSPAENVETVDTTITKSGVSTHYPKYPTRQAPGVRILLDKSFFTTKVLQAPAGKLLNNNVFKEYLRGLYFNVDYSGSEAGNLAMLDIKKGTIAIYYKWDKLVPNTNGTYTIKPTKRVLNLTFAGGKSISLPENTPNPTINTDRLYLKGGQGSMAVIDLFGRDASGFSQQLQDLRAKKWLVNDASLTFYIDNTTMGSETYEPNRIYLYDFKNKVQIIDYNTDQTTNSTKPKYSKIVHGGIIKKANGRGTEYKIRLTDHIRNLLKYADSTNVRLGLVVTENINVISNKKLKSPITTLGISTVPGYSVINPLGTVLYGSGDNVPEAKRLKLNIYFTKPKQN